jgi:hypothetical protein
MWARADVEAQSERRVPARNARSKAGGFGVARTVAVDSVELRVTCIDLCIRLSLAGH